MVQSNNEATTEMANTPKMKDPTEAALSAIQDALNVRDAEPSSQPVNGPLVASIPAEEPAGERTWPGLRGFGRAAKAEPFEDATHRPDDTDAPRRPANDDRESIGQILRSLQRRPPRTSFLVASVVSAV